VREATGPTDFYYHYPVEVSPLAKRSKRKIGYYREIRDVYQRMEIANGFNELNDPEDQKARFEGQIRENGEGAMMTGLYHGP